MDDVFDTFCVPEQEHLDGLFLRSIYYRKYAVKSNDRHPYSLRKFELDNGTTCETLPCAGGGLQ